MKAKTETKPPHEVITGKILSILEEGQHSGTLKWKGQGAAGRIPFNLKTGRPYTGVNVLSLWVSAEETGYGSNAWCTFKQALDLGGSVRKGEKSTLGVYFDTVEKPTEGGEEGESRRIRFAKAFHLFNAEQIDGIDAPTPPKPWDPKERAEAVISGSGAVIIESGVKAYYRPSDDTIRLPDRWRFECPENYYAVAMHELAHWTGHESRLARDLKNRFGSDAYAMEELVAELGSAFLSAETGIEGKLELHANYIGSWLRVLKNDKRAIIPAASAASKAAGFLMEPLSVVAQDG